MKTLEIDKQFLLSELGQMKVKYGDLHGQIDQMTKLVSEKQVSVARGLSTLCQAEAHAQF